MNINNHDNDDVEVDNSDKIFIIGKGGGSI